MSACSEGKIERRRNSSIEYTLGRERKVWGKEKTRKGGSKERQIKNQFSDKCMRQKKTRDERNENV